ncbi:putative bifunctional diguanylate cyclase/phosphodiesterase [Marinomonas colpomeniae]|uniref:EAL domain-containing protein n=1 Tax=Marinomonas colpomeniae TaxID=2774408 RepID=A0ABR8P2H3_9GAMM|nr:EAL domain-containing protein [Marinomonas colpomeniae]MBD5772489.1 EAL domain-containing protein [Marinomonas colpomeniae]
MAETKIENQHQTVSLLLNDFEEKASDWLWETNKKGHLRHLSQKLIEATDTDADRLLTLTYIDIIESLLATNETNSATQFKKMTRALTTNSDVSSIVIPVNLGHETRWWSFSAKILLDKDKKFNGLRGVTSDITSVVLREREMIKQANTDTLTKIGNRHFFNEQLLLLCSESVNHHSPCALMLLDLDNFKMINDAFGHAAGDGLLVEASKRLKENTPQGAILARLGGDEFAIIVPNASGQSIMRALSEKIKYTISEPWHYGENQIEIRTSIGIAFTNQNIGSIETLLRASDLALYAAKEAGRDAICFFDPAMEETANHKSQVLSEMRKSISDNEFVLHYQPQLDLITGKLIGFEALVRWQHPKRGLITPIHFISIAEESGLIIPLGIWVLEQACFEAKKWPSDLYVAVNVSYIQIERTDFLAEVKSVLHNTQLPPHRLEIEITESVLMTDQTPAFQFLMGLKEMGVKIALDDFGTGFSSLSYLQNLPLDKIKIDQSFINLSDTDDKTCAIIRSITQLADALELETIAEGIEREGQYKLLSDLGVKSGQGYLYARPMQVDDLPFFIESKRKLP